MIPELQIYVEFLGVENEMEKIPAFLYE
jgi:hypothetical protein